MNLSPFGRFKSWLCPQASPLIRESLSERRGPPLRLEELPWKNGELDVGLEWAEFRWVTEVRVQFERPAPDPDLCVLEYWSGITSLQGSWLPVEERSRPTDPSSVIGTSIGAADSSLIFALVFGRRTCKIRIRLLGRQRTILRGFEVYGVSKWRSGEALIEWGDSPTSKRYSGTIEAYNGEILALSPVGGTRLTGPLAWSSAPSGGSSQGILAKVLYTDSISVDRTVLTVRSPTGTFSFLAHDAIEGSPIDLRDFGIFVRRKGLALDRDGFRRENAGRFRIIDAVRRHPEQSLENAYRRIRSERVTLSFVGVDCNSHKFGIAPDGHVVIGGGDPRRGAPMRGRFALYFASNETAAGTTKRPQPTEASFGISSDKQQELEEGWLPIMITRWGPGDLTFERRDYAVLPGVPGPWNEAKLAGTELAVMISRLDVRNDSPAAKTLDYYIKAYKPVEGGLSPREMYFGPVRKGEPNAWESILDQNRLVVLEGSSRSVVCKLDTHGHGDLTLDSEHGAVVWSMVIEPGGERVLHVVIPGRPLPESEAVSLDGLVYDQLHESVVRYWKARLSETAQIEVPDQHVQNLFNASLHHFLLAITKDVQRDEYYPNAAVFDYSCIGSESSPIMQALDMRGLKALAGKCLRSWLTTQGSAWPGGDYHSKEGGFYYFWPFYTIDQGPVLWALAEHYLYTRDKQWLSEVSPRIVAGCDFIIRERRREMMKLASDPGALEYGLAPPGTVCDMRDWQYSFMLNGYFYLGLKKSAQVLADVDPENSRRIGAEAEDYRQAILKAFRECMALSPVMRLRDGSSAPSGPSYVGIRGYRYDVHDVPDPGYGDGMVMDTTCGALHLLNAEVLRPTDREVGWMLNGYEDRFFMESPVQSPVKLDALSTDWFNLGGFEKLQPYYLHQAEAYLQRDEIPNFIRAFYNTLAAISDPQTLTFRESLIFPSGSEPNKTHEEAWFFQQLRRMLLMEMEDELFLARGVPRDWFQHGKQIAVKRAPSYFGEVSYQIRSFVNDGRIEAIVTLPGRNLPRRQYLRFRHPGGAAIRRVTLDGRRWSQVNVQQELIGLPQGQEIEVVAYYD